MRRRLSYANVTATLALVFAMSGGALAANHYLIESTKQIKPSVLKKLKGARGAKGANGTVGTIGPAGAAGAAGKEGPQGKEGKTGKEGPEGESATKLWAAVNEAGALVKSSGAASAEKLSTGVYAVKFDQDITECALLGTTGATGFTGTSPGEISVQGKALTTDSLFIQTFTTTGTAANREFYVAVLC
jgi:hypothetical protein